MRRRSEFDHLKKFESWGIYPPGLPREVFELLSWEKGSFPDSVHSCLPVGLGRSYGDCGKNIGQALISLRHANTCISFDAQTGILRAFAGISLADIIRIALPQGWFLPVSPGTKWVSLGGAIANDVHGKNHHAAGCFGNFVRCFELLRSNGERLLCSATENTGLFQASIGGLGLTGIMLWAEIQLIPAKGPYIDFENEQFHNLDEFFELSSQSAKDFAYTVAWLDCTSTGKNFGRGIFMRGNHSQRPLHPKKILVPQALASVPCFAPSWLLNGMSIRAFNFLYYHKQRSKRVSGTQHYNSFFYPLDILDNWNKLYGRAGFLQFQCVLPHDAGRESARELFRLVVDSGRASFLAVAKEFGDIRSPGILSFPRPGLTLCLDFSFRGKETLTLFRKLHDHVLGAGGALYPAKDACMSAEDFVKSYPRLEEFLPHRDEGISSSFWRRVMEEKQ